MGSDGGTVVSPQPKQPIPPTPEQAAALLVDGSSVALVSGAGCGKTRVLTDRYLRAIDGAGSATTGLPAVLALTFTEKAARELRERVRRACRERLAEEPNSSYWREVRRGLEAAPISTFHGFCGGVLRAFPIAAGVEPGFRILDDSLAVVLRRQALDDSIRRRLIAGDAGLRRLVVRLGMTGVREVAAAQVAGRSGRDFSKWRDFTREEAVEAWRASFATRAEPIIAGALSRGSAVPLRRLRPHDCLNESMRDHLLEVQAAFSAIDSGSRLNLDECGQLLEAGGRNSIKFWPSKEDMDRVGRARTRLKELVKKARMASVWDEELAGRMVEETRALCALVCDSQELYDGRKREAGVLDFDDLQARLLTLLKYGPDQAVMRIRESIRLILVDEFQDTDPVQAEILELLAGETAGTGRLFLVGDVKQSIYGFRGAEPALLGRFRDRFPSAGRLQLTRNFRSTPAVIEFANALFAEVFDAPEDRLEAARTGPAQPSFPPVTFVKAASGGAKTKANERRDEEAKALARLLRSRIDAGWMIHDPNHGALRRAEAGDVVVLLRAIHHAAMAERAMMDEGFECYVIGGSTFYTQPEVLDLINLLTCLEDPTDEVALAGLLRSGFFAVSDEALYWLSRSPGGTLLDGLRKSATSGEELPMPDRERVRRAANMLGRWRNLKDKLTIGDLLDRALDESGYEAALLAQRQGGRMRANCRKLVRVARAFDAYGGLGLADFVERLKADYDNPPKESQESTTDEQGNAIRIMTVHQAKGLEFPIVVVPHIDREEKARTDQAIYMDEFGPILKGLAPLGDAQESESLNPIEYLAVQHLQNLEREEELRILYVAVTRAREALLLSSGRPPEEARNSPWFQLMLERFDLDSGECIGEGPETTRIEVVDFDQVAAVAGDQPEIVRVDRIGKKREERPRLLAIAKAVEEAANGAEANTSILPDEPPSTPNPLWLDLDAGPLESPRELAVFRLIQAVCGSAECYRTTGVKLRRLIEELGQRLVPAATPGVVTEVFDRLEAWGPSRLSSQGARELRTGLPWEIRNCGGSSTTCRGRTELVWKDSEGGWHVVHVAGAALNTAADATEWLRAACGTRCHTPEPVVDSRLVLLGREGAREFEMPVVLDDRGIADQLARVLNLRATLSLTGEW